MERRELVQCLYLVEVGEDFFEVFQFALHERVDTQRCLCPSLA